MTAKCRSGKKQHETESDAIVWHNLHSARYDEWWVYKCSLCHKFHLSYSGFSEHLFANIIEIIQANNGNDDDNKQFIERINAYKTIWEVKTYKGKFLVEYRRNPRKIIILEELFDIE